MERRYIAFDPMNQEFEFFQNLGDAKKWILDQDWRDQGLPEEIINGEYLIARVTHKSSVDITERREDYPCLKNPEQHAVCSGCDFSDDECEGAEEWPYENDSEWAGEPKMIHIKNS